MQCFFALCIQEPGDEKYGPDSIYNLDETGISTVQNRPNVIAVKETKQVGQITATGSGTLVTACCCLDAVERRLPHVMAFLGVHHKVWMTSGAPAETLGLATHGG